MTQAEAATDTAALDAWLAEHLLGAWTCDGCTETMPNGSAAFHGLHWHIKGTRTSSLGLSTTGDGLVLVVEALKARRWYVVLYVEDGEPCRASVTEMDAPDDRVPLGADADADTLPLAVALAARQAIEAETGT